MSNEVHRSVRKIDILAFAVICAVGVFLRLPPQAFAPGAPLHSIAMLHPQPAFRQIGFDENLYRQYVDHLSKTGIGSYPDMVESYIATQSTLPNAVLPPVRFLYIFSAYIWRSIFDSETMDSLRDVAAFFSILTVLLAPLFAWRMRGPRWGFGVAALIATAPTQIHMSQHALIDGFFAFWALLSLWLLWECVTAPGDWRWLTAYALALALLVMTKENSFFVWLGLVAIILANRWLQFGITSRALVLATIAGPLLGVVMLVFLAGGLGNLIETYRLLVTKAAQTPYAVLTGDGPWYRYLVDLMLVSPIVLLLALGTIFRINRTMKPELYLAIFIAASYLVMCNVRYGMNLRYANMWDTPLSFLAVSSLVALVTPLPRYRNLVLGIAVGFVALIEVRQYIILAVQYPLYELITHDLLQALHILKSP
jgi:4-amino-4-deoxy-L-arabinose transferase-like glycosyltransferase